MTVKYSLAAAFILIVAMIVFMYRIYKRLKDLEKKQESFKGWRVEKIGQNYHLVNEDQVSILESSGNKIKK